MNLLLSFFTSLGVVVSIVGIFCLACLFLDWVNSFRCKTQKEVHILPVLTALPHYSHLFPNRCNEYRKEVQVPRAPCFHGEAKQEAHLFPRNNRSSCHYFHYIARGSGVQK